MPIMTAQKASAKPNVLYVPKICTEMNLTNIFYQYVSLSMYHKSWCWQHALSGQLAYLLIH